MTDNKNNFIEKIKFNDDFHPFKGGDEILFGGEKEVQEIIEFYLKNKPENKDVSNKEIKENAERFKMNCILGNNGGGKSRLFEGIINNDEKIEIDNFEGKEIILDDFFVLSNNYKKSSHYEFLSPVASRTQSVINDFIFWTYNYLLTTNNKIISSFFNLRENFIIELWPNKYEGNYNLLDKGFIKRIENNDILKTRIDSTGVFYIYEFLSAVFLGEYKEKFPNIFSDNSTFKKVLEDKDKNKILLILFRLLFTPPGKIKRINENIEVNEDEYLLNINKLFQLFEGKVFDSIELNIFSKIKINYKNSEKLEKLLESFFGITNIDFSDYNNEGKIFNFNKELTKEEQYILTYVLSGDDLKFENKFFGNLSAGESLMLIRFSDIYTDIISKKEKKEFTILIDEPDLHLHLDWQKKYIQKLIDVFSTLDINIKLHFVIATHSPFIISDLPSESIILLDKKEGADYTEIKNYDGNKQEKGEKLKNQTFGANYVDIIRNGFFFGKDQMLMGGLSENVIGDIAEKRRKEITSDEKIENIELLKGVEDKIGDDFLIENLLYFKKNNNAED